MSPPNDTFKALADPSRREILRYLRERDMTAGEIAEKFAISKPSISHHLSILKQADLVTDKRQGQNIVYALNVSVFEELVSMLMDFLGWEKIDVSAKHHSEPNDINNEPNNK